MRKLLLSITIIAVIAMAFGSLAIVENLTTRSYAKSPVIEERINECGYLLKKILYYMDLANRSIRSETSTHYSLLAANYLKLYDLCGCHKYYAAGPDIREIVKELQKKELKQWK